MKKKYGYVLMAGMLSMSMTMPVMAANASNPIAIAENKNGATVLSDAAGGAVGSTGDAGALLSDETTSGIWVNMMSVSEQQPDIVYPGTVEMICNGKDSTYVMSDYAGGKLPENLMNATSLDLVDVTPHEDLTFLGVIVETKDGTRTFEPVFDVDFEADVIRTFAVTDGLTLTMVFGDEGQEFTLDDAKETCTITYDAQDGHAAKVVSVNVGDAVTFPTPEREGYTFLGWFDAPENGTIVAPFTATEDIKLYGYWEEIVQPDDGSTDVNDPTDPDDGSEDDAQVKYTVTFDTQGGDAMESQIVVSGEDIDLADPVREGYTFAGWFDAPENGNKVETLTVTGDVTLYAHWTKVEAETVTYTITLDKQDESEPEKLVVDEGETVTFEKPTREGYIFMGWYTKPEQNRGNRVISLKATRDVTLYAHWGKVEEVHTITFDTQGGSEVDIIKAVHGTTVSMPKAPVKDGYRFMGWFTEKENGEKVTTISVENDMTLYAQWEKVAATYTVTYSDGVDGKAFVDVVYAVKEGLETPSFGKDPYYAGYVFDGWDKDIEKTVTGDVTYTAKWKAAEKKAEDTKKTSVKTTSDKDTSEVSQEGKEDVTAPPVKTADANLFSMMGMMGASLSALSGSFVFWKKRKKDDDEI